MNDEYRERLTAPLSWWLGAIALSAFTGWIVRVATTFRIGLVVAIVVALIILAGLARYGWVSVRISAAGIQAGPARLEPRHIGQVEALDTRGWARAFGPEGDVRAYTFTRPYVRTGVRISVDDPADPTPFWLVSTRFPESVARALIDRS